MIMRMNMKLPNIGTTVAYHPELARFLGSIKAAIFIDQLTYWSGKQKDKDGWIYKTTADFGKETALSRHELVAVRELLKGKGYLKEKLKQIPPKVHYLLEWHRIVEDWKFYRAKLPDSSKTIREKMEKGYAEARQNITESTHKNTSDNTDTRSFYLSADGPKSIADILKNRGSL